MKKFKKLIAGVVAAAISAVCMIPYASSAAEITSDPNGDGSLDIADYIYIVQYLAGKFEPADISRLDVDKNGVVSQMDAYCVQLKEAGLWEEEK